jgi:hypothetical protein
LFQVLLEITSRALAENGRVDEAALDQVALAANVGDPDGVGFKPLVDGLG